MDGPTELKVRLIKGGGISFATVNQMDLQAAISALKRLKKDETDPIVVRSNSGYLINNAARYLSGWKDRGWKKRDGKFIENADLWRELDKALNGRTLRWMLCDTDDPHLVEVTKLAQAAAAKHV